MQSPQITDRLSVSSALYDALDMPENVWILIMVFCDLRDLLSLEQACKFLYRLASSRPIWIRHLHSLDQAHAPAVHPKTSIHTLSGPQLRELVVRAGCVHHIPPRITRDKVLSLNVNVEVMGKLSEWGSELLLLPDGQHLLMKWPRGYLQCWNVSKGTCPQTYPPLPESSSENQQIRVLCFDYDVCHNDNIFLLVLSEYADSEAESRIMEIFTFSSPGNSLTLVHRQMPTELGKHHGKPIFVKIHRDIAAVCFEGRLVVQNWAEGHLLSIDNIILDDLQVLDDYLVGVQDRMANKFLTVIPLSHITCILREDGPDTASRHIRIRLTDLLTIESPIVPPALWLISRATLSMCALHWRYESECDLVSITVLADVYSESDVRDFPVVFSFLLRVGPGDVGLGANTVDSIHGAPLPQLIFCGHTEIAITASSMQDLSTYSILYPPSRCATAVFAFHSDGVGIGPVNGHDLISPDRS